MNLDSVLTVAIGRNDVSGAPLSDAQWDAYQAAARATIETHGATIVAATNGGAIGSDATNNGAPEETAVFVAINVAALETARAALAALLPTYRSTSMCFAFDLAHEPVFATTDGFRPRLSEVSK